MDTSSRLYAATEFLFTRLAQFPITTKGQIKSETPQHPPPPLESLLRLLTPRETAFCLSDIRRTARLRAHLAWRASGGFATTGSDLSTVGLNSVDQKDGIFGLSGGILRALAQSHITEEGLACLVPRFLNQLTTPSDNISGTSRRIASILNSRADEPASEQEPEEDSEMKDETRNEQSVIVIDEEDGDDQKVGSGSGVS